MYFRDANVVIIVYDVTSRQSYDEVTYWVKESKNTASYEDFVTAIVGNKCDMPE